MFSKSIGSFSISSNFKFGKPLHSNADDFLEKFRQGGDQANLGNVRILKVLVDATPFPYTD